MPPLPVVAIVLLVTASQMLCTESWNGIGVRLPLPCGHGLNDTWLMSSSVQSRSYPIDEVLSMLAAMI
uniref:Putative secreted protein n=1 Tax=Anopheles triannulatus TaxID=58253 RepID=A0A2M4B794_9DIPT